MSSQGVSYSIVQLVIEFHGGSQPELSPSKVFLVLCFISLFENKGKQIDVTGRGFVLKTSNLESQNWSNSRFHFPFFCVCAYVGGG